MKIGVPREVKEDEYRVSVTPAGARELTDAGHTVLVESGAGVGSGIPDEDYRRQGAIVVDAADAVLAESELLVKVQEPQPEEVSRLTAQHVLFIYLHLAAAPGLTQGLMESGAMCVAYETVQDARGRLPLLAPMSEVAGKIAAQAGAFMLEKPFGVRGILLGGVPGVDKASVMIVGGGVVGRSAATVIAGMGANVPIYDRNLERLHELELRFFGSIGTCFASTLTVEEQLPHVDLVIGAVLVRGARAPRIVERRHLASMKPGAVLVDVSIDQGGCFETSRPTTHSESTYEVDGVTYYCVANVPGAVPITSTYALSNATLPYVHRLAGMRRQADLLGDPELVTGLNICTGKLTCRHVTESLGLPYTPPAAALQARRVEPEPVRAAAGGAPS